MVANHGQSLRITAPVEFTAMVLAIRNLGQRTRGNRPGIANLDFIAGAGWLVHNRGFDRVSSTTFTIRVDTGVKKRLEKLARSTGRSRSFLAAEARCRNTRTRDPWH